MTRLTNRFKIIAKDVSSEHPISGTFTEYLYMAELKHPVQGYVEFFTDVNLSTFIGRLDMFGEFGDTGNMLILWDEETIEMFKEKEQAMEDFGQY